MIRVTARSGGPEWHHGEAVTVLAFTSQSVPRGGPYVAAILATRPIPYYYLAICYIEII